MQQYKTDRLTPDSSRMQTTPDSTITSYVFLQLTLTSQIVTFCRISQTELSRSSVTDIGY
jgi:hypothetical protein